MIQEIVSRRSVRKYKPAPVDDTILARLLESARLAPSGSNKQPWRFVVVKSEEMRAKIAKVSHDQPWMTGAPVHIVCVADPSARAAENAQIAVDEESPLADLKGVIRDTAIAIEHMVLEAESEGLATCWVAWFVQKDIRPVLNIPEDKFVVAILTVGYPDENPPPRPRAPMEELVHYETW